MDDGVKVPQPLLDNVGQRMDKPEDTSGNASEHCKNTDSNTQNHMVSILKNLAPPLSSMKQSETSMGDNSYIISGQTVTSTSGDVVSQEDVKKDEVDEISVLGQCNTCGGPGLITTTAKDNLQDKQHTCSVPSIDQADISSSLADQQETCEIVNESEESFDNVVACQAVDDVSTVDNMVSSSGVSAAGHDTLAVTIETCRVVDDKSHEPEINIYSSAYVENIEEEESIDPLFETKDLSEQSSSNVNQERQESKIKLATVSDAENMCSTNHETVLPITETHAVESLNVGSLTEDSGETSVTAQDIPSQNKSCSTESNSSQILSQEKNESCSVTLPVDPNKCLSNLHPQDPVIKYDKSHAESHMLNSENLESEEMVCNEHDKQAVSSESRQIVGDKCSVPTSVPDTLMQYSENPKLQEMVRKDQGNEVSDSAHKQTILEGVQPQKLVTKQDTLAKSVSDSRTLNSESLQPQEPISSHQHSAITKTDGQEINNEKSFEQTEKDDVISHKKVDSSGVEGIQITCVQSIVDEADGGTVSQAPSESTSNQSLMTDEAMEVDATDIGNSHLQKNIIMETDSTAKDKTTDVSIPIVTPAAMVTTAAMVTPAVMVTPAALEGSSSMKVQTNVQINPSNSVLLDSLTKPALISYQVCDTTGKNKVLTQKLSSSSLQKARTMLHSALGTTQSSDNSGTANYVVIHSGQGENRSDAIVKKENNVPLETYKRKSIDEQGDILDILKTHDNMNTSSTVPTTPMVEKVKAANVKPVAKKHSGSQIAKKSTTKKAVNGVVKGSEKKQMVKPEPVDDYDYESSQSSAGKSSTDNLPAPAVVMENVLQGSQTSLSGANSLAMLSNQVNRLQSVALPVPNMVSVNNNNQMVTSNLLASNQPFSTQIPSTTLPQMPVEVLPGDRFNVQGLLPHYANSTFSTATPVLQQPGKSADTFVPFLVQREGVDGKGNQVTIKMQAATSQQQTQLQYTIPPHRRSKPAVKPTVKTISVGPQALKAQKPMAIQPKPPPPPPPQVTIAPTPAVQSTAVKQVTQAPTDVLQDQKLKKLYAMPVSSINIDTVGLPKITELIARKNPIPNYKPCPVPNELKSFIEEPSFLCYECGDSFNLSESLEHHRRRYSMKITYKCDDCNKEKCFFNKCQFLGHLRQHLNIDKTQAVPIHIKSDSIAISTLPKIYEHLIFPVCSLAPAPVDNEQAKESRKETKTKEDDEGIPLSITKPTVPKPIVQTKKFMKRCKECGMQITNETLEMHYKSLKTDCDTLRHCCGICHMSLPSICSLRSHRRLHQAVSPFVCPECGMAFHDQELSSEGILVEVNLEEAFCRHLLYECCHASRVVTFGCIKCGILRESSGQMRSHMMSKVDQYVKCQECPMAFKSYVGFEKHYLKNHKPAKEHARKLDSNTMKNIYRCHVCDVVMDDLAVLEDHTTDHVKECLKKAVYNFKCLLCRQMYKKQVDLKTHTESHVKQRDLKKCIVCTTDFSSEMNMLTHVMVSHRDLKVDDYKPCRQCKRIVNASDTNPSNHPCIAKKLVVKNIGKKAGGFSEECKICKKVIKSKQAFVDHIVMHRVQGILVCCVCFSTDFNNMQECLEHEMHCSSKDGKKVSIKKEHECPECKYLFTSRENLKHHRMTEHAFAFSNLFPCHLCEHAYKDEPDLKRHIAMKHEAKRSVFTCSICKSRGLKKVFTTRALLERHLTSRHKRGRVQIEKSLEEDNADSESDLNDEESGEGAEKRKSEEKESDHPVKKLRVEGGTSFSCAKCSCSVGDRQTFLNHLKVHKVDNFLQCLECGLSFAVIPTLRKHLFMVHKVRDFESYCRANNIDIVVEVDDDEEIKVVPPMDIDMESDVDEKPIPVAIAETNKDPLKCRICHQTFESEGHVQQHMRTHGMAFLYNKRRSRVSPNKSSVSNGWDSSDSSSSSTKLSETGLKM